MIGVRREIPTDAEWADWNERARLGTEALVKAYERGEDIAIRATLYKEAKRFLDRLFGGKCAYCEVVIEASHPTEVEHYRPKGGLKDENGELVLVKKGSAAEEHGGYWWLAYEWSNLLPSCIDCNRRRAHGEASEKGGKADIFPVQGFRATKPGEHLNEVPMLLNPCDPDFNPAEHFEFLKDGTLKPKTERAVVSCRLLGLNIREKAVARRASL
jgi:uncharacterized protein (TIGR02646 family)